MRLRLKQRDVKFVLDAHAMCKYEQENGLLFDFVTDKVIFCIILEH